MGTSCFSKGQTQWKCTSSSRSRVWNGLVAKEHHEHSERGRRSTLFLSLSLSLRPGRKMDSEGVQVTLAVKSVNSDRLAFAPCLLLTPDRVRCLFPFVFLFSFLVFHSFRILGEGRERENKALIFLDLILPLILPYHKRKKKKKKKKKKQKENGKRKREEKESQHRTRNA